MATDRTRLYLLLMMNIGATEKDIADLTPDEYDKKNGTITRIRSKHQNRDQSNDIPTVTYNLWDTTNDLLKKGKRSTNAIFRRRGWGQILLA